MLTMFLFKLLITFASMTFYQANSQLLLNLFVFTNMKHLQNEFKNQLLKTVDTGLTKQNWIELPLDHFDKKENRKWNMSYFEKMDFWKEGGPTYFCIGGQFKSDLYIRTGPIHDLAKETHGALFTVGHRFYEDSLPLPNSNNQSLKYLSSRQALADMSKILKAVKKKTSKHSKVVVVGGSYAGSLATWMRLKYPRLVDAAIASSAPLLAKKDFYEYMEAVADNYKKFGSDECIDKIKKTFDTYTKLLKSSKGIAKLKKEQHICDSTDMRKPLSQQFFFMSKIITYQFTSQFGEPSDIKQHCEWITKSNESADLQEEYMKFPVFKAVSKKRNCWSCEVSDLYEHIDSDHKAWLYQQCTEFGFFETLTSKKQPFGHGLDTTIYIEVCQKLFRELFSEEKLDKAINNTNKLYGGLKPKVTNVVFVNGGLDPWSRLAVRSNLSSTALSKVIQKTSQCRDLFPSNNNDEEELIAVRDFMKMKIKYWIGFKS